MVVTAVRLLCVQEVPVMILSKTNFWFRHTRLTPRTVYQMRAVSLHFGRDYHREPSKNTGYKTITIIIHVHVLNCSCIVEHFVCVGGGGAVHVENPHFLYRT